MKHWNFIFPALLLVSLLVARLFLLRILSTHRRFEGFQRALKTPSLIIGLSIPIYLLLELLEIPKDYHKVKSVSEGLVVGVIVLGFALLFANLSEELVRTYLDKVGKKLPPTGLIFNVVRFTFLILGFLTVMNIYGISITHFITTLGIGALAVSLALRDTLSNFFSGVNLLLSGQIKIGDYVVLESGQEGYIEDITWMNTVIRTRRNIRIIVPNARLTSSIVQNHTKDEEGLIFSVSLGVSYSSDLEKVERVALEVAKELQGKLEQVDGEFEPYVRFTGFGESSINLELFLKVKHADYQFIIRHEFIKMLKERFEKEGIEIPFPQRVVRLVEATRSQSS